MDVVTPVKDKSSLTSRSIHSLPFHSAICGS
jgi:hypothetical protein